MEEDSRVVGFSRDIRVVVGEVAEGGEEGGDQSEDYIIWRFMYKTTIPRKLSREMKGKCSSYRLDVQELMMSIGCSVPDSQIASTIVCSLCS